MTRAVPRDGTKVHRRDEDLHHLSSVIEEVVVFLEVVTDSHEHLPQPTKSLAV